MVPSPEAYSALYILVDNGSFLSSKRMLLHSTSLSKAFCPKRQLSNHQCLWLNSSCMRLATIPTVWSPILEEENLLNSHKIYIKKKMQLLRWHLHSCLRKETILQNSLLFHTIQLSSFLMWYPSNFLFPEERTMQNITACTGSTSV